MWIGNTGASTHMKNTMEGLYDLREENTTVHIGNGKSLNSTMIGTLKATVQQLDGTTIDVKLNNVVYVPELSINLLSITKAIENGFQVSNEGNIMSLTKGSMTIKFDKIQKTKNGFCPGIIMKTKLTQESAYIAQIMTYTEGHQKLGHPGEELTKATANKIGWKMTKKTEECESCPIGKARQKNLNRNSRRKSVRPGQVFASDISSVTTEAIGGRRYWLLVIDQYTSMKWSFFLKSKDEQASVLTNFVKDMLHHVKIERWKFDNAGENKTTQAMFEKEGFGIKYEYTARETPQQNGMVERAFATLYGRARAMMMNAGFEKLKRETLWLNV